MRVIGEQRLAGGGAGARRQPSVARGGRCRQAESGGIIEDRSQRGDVEPGIRRRSRRREILDQFGRNLGRRDALIGREQQPRALGADPPCQTQKGQLAARVPRLGPGHVGADHQTVFGAPRRGFESGDQIFQRPTPARAVAIGIDPGGIGVEQGAIRLIHSCQCAPDLDRQSDGAKEAVDLHRFRTEEFGQTPAGEPAQQIHLPHPLRGRHIALGEDQIPQIARLDGRHGMGTETHLDRMRESGQRDRARIGRFGALGQPIEWAAHAQ